MLSELHKLNDEYQDAIKIASKKSNEMLDMLDKYYTKDKLDNFESFEDFLDDINGLLPSSTAKVLFIKKVADIML